MIFLRNVPLCRRVALSHLQSQSKKFDKSCKHFVRSNGKSRISYANTTRHFSLSARCRNLDLENASPVNGEFVSITLIKQKLLKFNREIDDGSTCVSIACTFCDKPSKIYINKVTGHFICYRCGQAGSWPQLESVLREPSSTNCHRFEKDSSIVAGATAWEKLRKHLHPIGKLARSDRNAISEKLGIEKLPWSLLDEQGVMYDSKNGDVYWPLSLCGHSELVPGYKTFSSTGEEQCFPHASATGVVRVCSKEGTATSAVLVPSLKDLFVLSLNHPKDTDIICLPHGQFSLPQNVLPLLERYKKLVLWFGNDVTSWDNVRLFSRKLSIERCHLVRPIKEHISAFEAYKSNMNVAESIKNAQAMSHSSIITFTQLRDDLLTELYSSDKASGIKWTRFPALNSILHGHRRGELTILTGPTGSGKTTFMSEYSLDLAMQKVTTLWGSFEIRNQRLVRTMLQQMAATPLQTNRDKFDEWADKFALLPIYFMTFHGQQPLDTVLDTVQHAAYVHDVAHVIIDNVQFMLGLSSSETGFLDRFYRQDALIGAFRNFATTYNCHVTLVIHPRKERDGESLTTSSIFGGAKASQEADNVLIIQHKFSNSGLKIKKYLQVAKNRFTGDLGIVPLEFDRESLSFGAKSKKS